MTFFFIFSHFDNQTERSYGQDQYYDRYYDRPYRGYYDNRNFRPYDETYR